MPARPCQKRASERALLRASTMSRANRHRIRDDLSRLRLSPEEVASLECAQADNFCGHLAYPSNTQRG